MDAVEINGKVLTNVPLLDEIVYNCKLMIYGIVLKDEDEALKYETFESLQNGDAYVAISEGKQSFNMFNYGREILSKIPGLNESQIREYANDNTKIPEEYRNLLLRYASEEFIESYNELNNYYRCLNGLPDYGTAGLYIDITTIDTSGMDIYTLSYINNRLSDRYVPIHELSDPEIEILEVNGTLDKLREENPELKYLNHLGSKKISIYDSRKSPKFALLYLPNAEATEIQKRFKDLLEKNRVIFLRTIYSESYKFQSEYYDKFIIIMIILQTITDCITELPEYLIRRDVFDLRTVQYIFESNGIEYFPEIPMKFQIALVRNLNKLIKFKSTDKCIVDICSLFGFNNIKVFKYYILKDRKVEGGLVDPDYQYNTKEPIDISTIVGKDAVIFTDSDNNIFTDSDGVIFTGNETDMKDRLYLDQEYEDEYENYDIKFVKVPIDEVYDDYIRNNTNIMDYDNMIEGDDYWNGDKTRNDVINSIKDHDFNILRSKYISIEAIYNLTELTFQMCYFMNILFHNDVPKELLQVRIPCISNTTKFNIVDIFILLYAMGYSYNNSTDYIMDTQGKVLTILGFNFEADLTVIAEHIAEQGYTMEDLGVDGFIIPSSGILTFNQLMEIYTKNKDIYNHVVSQLIHPESKKLYDIYKYLYESLMITRLNLNYYKLPDGTQAKTFTEFLRYKSPVLYSYLIKFKSQTNLEERKIAIANAVNSICTYLEDYLNINELNYIFSNLPSVSLDFIKNYIATVINFFKSFKLHLLNISITYKFDNKLENTIPIIDCMLMKYIFEKSEKIKAVDLFKNIKLHMSKSEKMELLDKIYFDISTWVTKNYTEDISIQINDMIKEYFATFDFSDDIIFYDKFINLLISITIDDVVLLKFYHEFLVNLEKETRLEYFEAISDMIVNLNMSTDINISINDDFYIKTLSIILNERNVFTRDKYKSFQLNINLKDSYKNCITDRIYKIPTTEV